MRGIDDLAARYLLLRDLIVGPPVALRSPHSATRLDTDAHVQHRHLGAAEGAQQHQLVQIPEVADPEHLARDFAQPGPQSQVVAAECRSEEHTSELQSHLNLVCRLLLEKKKKNKI